MVGTMKVHEIACSSTWRRKLGRVEARREVDGGALEQSGLQEEAGRVGQGRGKEHLLAVPDLTRENVGEEIRSEGAGVVDDPLRAPRRPSRVHDKGGFSGASGEGLETAASGRGLRTSSRLRVQRRRPPRRPCGARLRPASSGWSEPCTMTIEAPECPMACSTSDFERSSLRGTLTRPERTMARSATAYAMLFRSNSATRSPRRAPSSASPARDTTRAVLQIRIREATLRRLQGDPGGMAPKRPLEEHTE